MGSVVPAPAPSPASSPAAIASSAAVVIVISGCSPPIKGSSAAAFSVLVFVNSFLYSLLAPSTSSLASISSPLWYPISAGSGKSILSISTSYVSLNRFISISSNSNSASSSYFARLNRFHPAHSAGSANGDGSCSASYDGYLVLTWLFATSASRLISAILAVLIPFKNVSLPISKASLPAFKISARCSENTSVVSSNSLSAS